MSEQESTRVIPPPGDPSFGQPPAPPAKRSLIARVATSRVFLVIALLVGMAMGGVGKGVTAGAASDAAPAPTVTMVVTAPASTSSPAPTATMTTTVAVTEAPARAFVAITEDGLYLVGTEIEPGTYTSDGGDGCYWARLNDITGGVDSSADNGVGGGQQFVTIRAEDAAFETHDCGAWTKIK